MPTISQGSRAELILAPGEVYRVTTGGTATVTGVYGAPSTTTTVTAGTQQFGPYQANAKLIVFAQSGSADYFLFEDRVNVLAQVDTAGRPIRTVTADGQVVGGGVFSAASLMDPAAWVDEGPIMSRPSALASWSWVSIVDTSKVPTITQPLARYYLYTATDHESRGGVRLLYANNIAGPWTLYTGGLAPGDSSIIYEDLDDTNVRPPASSTETPDVRWDPVAGKLRMFYHCINPCYGAGTGSLTNATDPSGARSGCTAFVAEQGTMSALSDDGLVWTKDRSFALDAYVSMVESYANDHTGYLGVSEYRGYFYGYHSIGGTLAGGHGLSRAKNLDEWSSDVRQLPRYTVEMSALGLPDYDMTYQWDVDWLGGRIIDSTDGPLLITKVRMHKLLSVLNGPTRLIAGLLTDDMRSFRIPPRIIGPGLLPFQKEGMGSFNNEATYGNCLDVVRDERGLAVVYLTANHMGVLRYVG